MSADWLATEVLVVVVMVSVDGLDACSLQNVRSRASGPSEEMMNQLLLIHAGSSMPDPFATFYR